MVLLFVIIVVLLVLLPGHAKKKNARGRTRIAESENDSNR
jgi:hypothetical protein